MPKRKKKSSIPFHRDFKAPSLQQRREALGSFPCESKANASRETMLRRSAERGQPSLEARDVHVGRDGEGSGGNGNSEKRHENENLALSDLDNKKLYIPTARSETSLATPKPQDELDWLAQVPEDGQSFDDYLTFLTSRTTGRMKPLANSAGIDIMLLPIIRSDPDSGMDDRNFSWPDYGPSIEKLVQYTRVFFDRPVHLLPAAHLQVTHPHSYTSSPTARGKSKRKKHKSSSLSNPGAFASKSKFKLYFPSKDSGGGDARSRASVEIAGRRDASSDRIQLKVDSLLDELSRYRYSRHNGNKNEDDFCIMGITMEDLYDGPSDLFCAGMAFGGDKVAVFSFKRYHPLIKMHPLHWHKYGYGQTSDGYSYYDNDDQDPKGLSPHPPLIRGRGGNDNDNDPEFEIEFLRRSSKLLSHELGHLYGLDHCIHNRCLMMGTGHLVEDFRAPSHLCGVCLRKLQWRLGFDVVMRYKILSETYLDMGLVNEHKWALKQYDHLS